MKVENARCNAGDPIVPQEIQIGQIPETLEFVHNNDSAALPARDSWAFGARVMVTVPSTGKKRVRTHRIDAKLRLPTEHFAGEGGVGIALGNISRPALDNAVGHRLAARCCTGCR